MTANADLGNMERPISASNDLLNSSSSSIDSSTTSNSTDTSSQSLSQSGNQDDLFQIAAKAEKLLQEILSAGKKSPQTNPVKQEPTVQVNLPQQQQQPQVQPQVQNGQFYSNQVGANFFQQQQQQQQQQAQLPFIQQAQFGFPPPNHQNYQQNFIRHPPPNAHLMNVVQPSLYYQMGQQPPQQFGIQQYSYGQHIQQRPQRFHQAPPVQYYTSPYMQQHPQPPQQYQLNHRLPPPTNGSNSFLLNKRKFGEINNYTNNNGALNVNSRSNSTENSYNSYQSQRKHGSTPDSSENSSLKCDNDAPSMGVALNEEEDLNLMRERELKDLKCKSVVEKMSVFMKYYQQFKEAYIHRVYTIECSDSLKFQFHSLIKYLNEYEALLGELDMMITEHERDHCKNNHRKTRKFFNKTKAFIRYECDKSLRSNIFEYRRLINSQDRYAGMYDLLDMNTYLISLLPDVGVSIRRYIRRCEKAKEQAQIDADEEEETFHAQWDENSNDSGTNDARNDPYDITIPTFKEFVATHGDDDETDYLAESVRKRKRSEDDEELIPTKMNKDGKSYESFSMGVDSLNRYLLKRVEDEETLDELVKERIIKWINKRQAKYILIFCEVDKLLNQHKAGECYQKFHSYLLFNLGKLVTVCDSYHQKLKELLYSTTIRRKKKRKKVKILPEAMSDVFDEIIDLKRALEHAKVVIKRCSGKQQHHVTQEVVEEPEQQQEQQEEAHEYIASNLQFQ